MADKLRGGSTVGGNLIVSTANYTDIVQDVTQLRAVKGFRSDCQSFSGASFTLDMNYNNFILTQTANSTISATNLAENIGATGSIILKGAFLPTLNSIFKTPNGQGLVTVSNIAVLNYFVASSTEIVCNYMNNFS